MITPRVEGWYGSLKEVIFELLKIEDHQEGDIVALAWEFGGKEWMGAWILPKAEKYDYAFFRKYLGNRAYGNVTEAARSESID